MALKDPTPDALLFEGEGAHPLAAAERFAAVRTLLAEGFAVRSVPAGPVPDPSESQVVLGRWRERVADPAPDSPAGRWRPITGSVEESVRAAVVAVRDAAAAPAPGAWLPWFPVIDYDRCTNCMQCLSFCLFGVYGVDAGGRIQAQHQDQCKTNCPACSRVCPEAAIMFPKYKAGPINGDTVSDADLQREKMKVDISALLGGDVYSLLRTRSERARSRFSRERDADKALAEREKCLVKLGQIAADVPPEVLASLPSPDEIARKAEEARRRAAAAGVPNGTP